MYRVTVKACGKKADAGSKKADAGSKKADAGQMVFEFEDPASDGARGQLNALADCLYDLDLDFDVDMDGDMLIDDLLMQVTEGEDFETLLGDRKRQFRVTGETLA